MTEKQILYLLAAGAALLYLRRSSVAGGVWGMSPILPSGPGAPEHAVGMLGEESGPGSGYRFPALPQPLAFTTDPATGQVYVVEQGYGGRLPWVSTSDILRGRA